jgi:hypothetical protein
LFLVCPTQSTRDCKELFYAALSTPKFTEQKNAVKTRSKKMENLEKKLDLSIQNPYRIFNLILMGC